MDSEHYDTTDRDDVPFETAVWHLGGPFISLLQFATQSFTYVFDIWQ